MVKWWLPRRIGALPTAGTRTMNVVDAGTATATRDTVTTDTGIPEVGVGVSKRDIYSLTTGSAAGWQSTMAISCFVTESMPGDTIAGTSTSET